MTPDDRAQQPQQNPELTRERFAALAGFDDPLYRDPSAATDSVDPDTATSDIDDDEIERQRSRHTAASHPLVKLGVVAVGVLGIIGLAALALQSLTGGGLWGNRHPTPPVAASPSQPHPKQPDTKAGKALTQLALKDQADALKNLGKGTGAKAKRSSPQKRAVPRPQSQPQPRIVYVAPKSPPVRPAYVPRPPVARPPERPQKLSADQVATEWRKRSLIGSFGSITPAAPVPSIASSSSTPSADRDGTLAIAAAVQGAGGEENETIEHTFSETDILPDTRAKARLSSQIAFTDQGGESQARYFAELTEPVRNASGAEVIPSGAKLVLQLDPSQAPLVTLTPIAVLLHRGRQIVQYPLPRGSVAIVSVSNTPLVAKEQRVNRRGRRDGLRVAVETIAQAGREIDLPGSNIPDQIYSRTRQNSHPYGATAKASLMYVLPSETPVTVVILEPLSLPVPQDSAPYVQPSQPNYQRIPASSQ